MKKILIVFIFLLSHVLAVTNNDHSNLYEKISSLPGIRIKVLDGDSLYSEKYLIYISQPLDHGKQDGKIFWQKLFLSHNNELNPVVMVIDGYAANKNFCDELAPLLNTNEIYVEHRFFGESVADSIDWSLLNLEQAVQDYHRILELFSGIYKNQWISAGWSKGGQTALAYRQAYPRDVVLTVAYDAPLNFSTHEERIDHFFETVGNRQTREKLIQFQRLVLQNKHEILPLFEWYTKGKKYTYSIGYEKALEYMVLEYPFSFWQYKKIAQEDIPGDGCTADQFLEHLIDVVSAWSYSDNAKNSPSMYQFYSELGYYEYVTNNVNDLLSDCNYPNAAFAPENIKLEYSPEKMKELNKWLQNKGNQIIYIYGELDPWSASSVELTGNTDAVKIYLKGGNHFTFISSFDVSERTEILKKLNFWLDNTK